MLKAQGIIASITLSILLLSAPLCAQYAQGDGELDFIGSLWQIDLDYDGEFNSTTNASIDSDSEGNVYVLIENASANGVVIQKYTSEGEFVWEASETLSENNHYQIVTLLVEDNSLYLRSMLSDGQQITKFTLDGSELWSYQANLDIYLFHIIEDLEANVYLMASGDNPDDPSLDQYIIQKIDSSGSLVWENVFTDTPVGSPSGMFGANILSNNNLILSMAVLGAGFDAGIMILSPEGNIVWHYGGQIDGSVTGSQVVIDSDSNLHYVYSIGHVPGTPAVPSVNYRKFSEDGEDLIITYLRPSDIGVQNPRVILINAEGPNGVVFLAGQGTIEDERVVFVLEISATGTLSGVTIHYLRNDCLSSYLTYFDRIDESFIIATSDSYEDHTETVFAQFIIGTYATNWLLFEVGEGYDINLLRYNFHQDSIYVLHDYEDPESHERNLRLVKNIIDEYYQHTQYSPGVATQFSINKCWPNPFNSTVNIKFTLPIAEVVVFSVYNSIGREVYTSPGKQYPVGQSVINWQAKDFSSGNYFIKIDTGSHSTIVPVLLIR